MVRECPNCGEDKAQLVSLIREGPGPGWTFGARLKCDQCHTLIEDRYTPAVCCVCLERIWRDPQTLSNGQMVHEFCLPETKEAGK